MRMRSCGGFSWRQAWALAVWLLMIVDSGPGSRAQTVTGSPEDLISRARVAYNDRKFSEAAVAYSEYLRLYPEGEYRDEAGFFYGQSRYLTHDYDQADAALAKEETLNRTYQDQALYYRGDIAAINQDYDRALVFFDRLLAEHSNSMMASRARTRRAEIYYLVGNQYLSQNALSLALQHYLQSLANAPPELKPRVMYKLGVCYFRLGDDKNAVQVWGELCLLDDQDSLDAALLARYRLARLFEDRGQLVQAEVNFKSFLEKAPDHFLAAFVREGLARVWARQGRVEEAVAYWTEEGGGKQMIDLSAKFAVGLEHFLHEEYPDAIRDFEWTGVQAADPELLWSSKLWLARSHQALGRVDLAARLYLEILSGSGRITDYLRIECARFMLAIAPARSEEMARIVIDNRGSYAESAAGISALALSALNDPEAINAADSYLAAYPQGGLVAEISLIRGRALLKKGELSRAEKDLLLALNQHPDPEQRLEAALILVNLYRSQGRLDSAKQIMAEARKSAALVLTPEERVMAREAEIDYARGEYEQGLGKYREICNRSAACRPEIKFRIFFGSYRSGNFEKAQEVLGELRAAGKGFQFKAGFWQGVMLLEQDDHEGALAALTSLSAEDELDKGLLIWELARIREKRGEAAEAIKLLSLMDRAAAGAGIFVRGEILRMALASHDFETFLANLPDPAETDKNLLSETALLSRLKTKAFLSPAPEPELEELLSVLKAVAIREETIEEAVFTLSKSRLSGPDRDKAMSQMARLIYQNPKTPFAAQIRFYQGEDAFLRKNYQGAMAWLSGLQPEDLPAENRFRLLYLQGQSYKMLRDTEKMRPCFLTLTKEYADQNVSSREWLDIGIGLILAREYTTAQVALDNVINNARDPGTKAEALYWKGMSQQGAGDLDAALETFLAIARDHPDQGMWVTTALYEAAGIYAEKGDYDRSLELYNQVLKRTKGDKKTSDQVKAKIAEVKKLKSLSSGGILPR